MENATIDEIKKAGLAGHYADHGKGVYPTDATGNPWTATFFQSKGDVIADLHENLAAEQKARATYEWLLNLTDDYEIKKEVEGCNSINTYFYWIDVYVS